MSNITKKERGLIKGALRRVFSRSELRRMAIDDSRVEHQDPERPRVKKWSKCPECKQFIPTYQMEVDHRVPVIPTDRSLEEMTWNELVERIFCDVTNLTALCKPCHNRKSKQEQKLRAQARKEKKNGKRS